MLKSTSRRILASADNESAWCFVASIKSRTSEATSASTSEERKKILRPFGAALFVVVRLGIVDGVVKPNGHLDFVRRFCQSNEAVELVETVGDVGEGVVVAYWFAVGGGQSGEDCGVAVFDADTRCASSESFTGEM